MKDRYRTELINGIFIISVLAGLIFGSWYILLNVSVGSRVENKAVTYLIDPTSISGDSIKVELIRYFNLTDSLKMQMQRMDDKYHNDVDLMISKANGWTAFWIGVIAIILGFLALWQVFRQLKVEEKFKVLQDNNEKMENVLTEKVEKQLENIGKRYNRLDEEKDNMMCTIHENRIAAAMMCISIPNPIIGSTPRDRRKAFKEQLNLISIEFHSYLELIVKRERNDMRLEAVVPTLMNIKIALVRARQAFSHYDTNVTFYEVIDKIDEAISIFRKMPIFVKSEDIELLQTIENKLKEMTWGIPS